MIRGDDRKVKVKRLVVISLYLIDYGSRVYSSLVIIWLFMYLEVNRNVSTHKDTVRISFVVDESSKVKYLPEDYCFLPSH